MSTDAKRAIIRRYVEEIWNGGNLALIDELFTPDYVNYDPASPGGVVVGRDGMKGLVTGFRTGVPDLRFSVEEQIAEGQSVVTRWTAIGTHDGDLMGLPATGLRATITGITITTFAGDLIAVDRVVWDALGMLRQLGAIPAATAA